MLPPLRLYMFMILHLHSILHNIALFRGILRMDRQDSIEDGLKTRLCDEMAEGDCGF